MMLDRVRQEIVDLHVFFEAWLSGRLESTPANFAPLESALGQDFHIVLPSAVTLDRDAILDAVREGHASRPTLEIWIENVTIRTQSTDRIVATYEEWQRESGDPEGRLSSVVFAVDGDRLTWLHVHETWLTDSSDTRRSAARPSAPSQ